MTEDPRIANPKAWGRWCPDGQSVERPPVTFSPVSALDLVHDHPDLRPVVIEGLLRKGEVMNIVAAPKVGKSWLTLGLVFAVAAGTNWLIMSTTRGRVLLIDAELHKETLAKRIQKTRSRARASDDDIQNVEVWSIRGKGWDIQDIATALSAVERGTYRLVVIDALYRVLPPGCEENRNEDMTKVYNLLDAIAAETDAAVIVVHHTTKGNQSAKAVTDVGSGAGAQSRAADTHLVLRQHEVEEAVVLDAAVRSFAPMRPFAIRSTNPGWELAPELDPTQLKLATPKKRGRQGEEAPPPPLRTWTPEEFAREIVGPTPIIKDEILNRARSAKLSQTNASSLLRRAESDGHLIRTQDGLNGSHRFAHPASGGSKSTPDGGDCPVTGTPPPELQAPGGVGGSARPPSPPPPRTDSNAFQPSTSPKQSGKRRQGAS